MVSHRVPAGVIWSKAFEWNRFRPSAFLALCVQTKYKERLLRKLGFYSPHRAIGNNSKRSRPMPKPTSSPVKQRHGCLTTYLVLVIIANSATAHLYLPGREAIKRSSPQHIPDWAFPVLIAVCLFNWCVRLRFSGGRSGAFGDWSCQPQLRLA